MICNVLWCHTTAEGAAMVWAALIAAVPAILAVIGAVIIGRRQLRLLDYQAALQAEVGYRAISVEAEKLKGDLWEKRFEVYEAARKFVSFMLTHGNVPGFNTAVEGQTLKDQMMIQADFIGAMDRSKFLFRPEVRAYMEHIWEMGLNLHHGKHGTPAAPEGETEQEAKDRVANGYADFRRRMRDLMTGLADVFGDQLMLANDR